jgi:hypothetical protein
MESTSSVAAVGTYQSMFDRGLEKPAQGPAMQSDTEVFTQPVARKPIDPQCGGADHDGGAIATHEQQPDDHASRLDYDSDLGSRRPL